MSARNHFPRTIQVSTTLEELLKPTRGIHRQYFFIQNLSANDIYINFGTHADVNNGFTLGAGLYYERDRFPPQEYVFVKGSQVASQQVQVIEG